MDYCHHCRRHLNGALACAGCGTPAEELRLHDPAPHEAEVVLATHGHSEEPVVGARRQRGSRKRKLSRRERRELRAERGAHRRKGRTVLLVVMGLVLAVGALSLAELALESSGDDGDATSVQEDRAIDLDGGRPPSGPPKPKDPGPVEGTPSTSSGSARPGGGDGSPDPSGTGTGTGAGTSDGESPSATDSPDPSDTPDGPGDPGDPTGSTDPTDGPSTPGDSDQPSAPQPSTSTTPPEEDDDDCVLWIICV
ncbi:hypothetical protein ACIBBB_09225 [Streptomyces sp. NPDC051217]|uniref:SCO2400 family protein n=1 Tax=Streptomyces sp. NPDC051217 TaxID=3365644 RepID=UPI003790F068